MIYLAIAVLVFALSGLLSMAGLGAAFIFVPLFYWLGVPLPVASSTALLLNAVPDLDTLQQALSRAVERHNMAMFTPLGHARELAAVTMRLAAGAIADGDTKLAAGILDQAQPESPDDSAATVAGCTGLALGPLDQWLSGHDTSAPNGLAKLTQLPAGHWTGQRSATDIITLARKGRAFGSLDSLIARQGGQHVLYGSALALAAALQASAQHTETPLTDLARTIIR